MGDILLINGEVWKDGGFQKKNILISNGKISAFNSPDEQNSEGIREIDAAGSLVFPGAVDMHAHVHDGAETFRYGTGSAVKGGVTTVLDMPPFKTVTNRKQCIERITLGETQAISDFGLIGGIIIDVEDLERLEEIRACGVHLFKIFMLSRPTVDLLWKSVQFAARTGMRMVVHMEEPSLLEEVNWDDPLGFPKANPPSAENVAVAQMLEMAKAAGAPIHVCHVSSARTAELIDSYKGWGTDVTAETTPHYLVLNEEAFLSIPDKVVATPALRKAQDNRILWQALRDGVLDAIVSDHFLGALPKPTKERPLPQDAEPGIAGLEVTFPLLYTKGVNDGNISLTRLVESLSSGPAQLSQINNRKGKIAIGMDADLIVFDPLADWEVSDLGKDSRISTLPYEGWNLKGRIDKTLVRGEVVWDGENILCAPGYGKFTPAQDE